jgi:PAS domain S-box-containing protein
LELVHPDDRPALEQYRHDVMSGRDLASMTMRLVKDGGQIIYVENWAKPLRADDGTVTGMFGTLQDVTARKQAEALIEQSRDSLARAETIALLGHTKFEQASGKYTWSAGLYRIMGKSPEAFTPTPDKALALIHPEDRPALAQYRRDVMAGIEVPRKTLRAIRDNGRIIYVEYWSVPIRASDGTVTAKFSTLQDVTARKQAEALIEESRNNLERAERQALLGHHKIEKASDQLTCPTASIASLASRRRPSRPP